MKIKRMGKVILVFITFLIMLALVITMIRYFGNVGASITDTIDYFGNSISSILGNENLAEHDVWLTNLFALVGVISITFFTAHLTVNLFWRTHDVLISDTMAIWKRNDRYMASVLIGNKGEPICRIGVSLSFFEKSGKFISDCVGEKKISLLDKNYAYKFDFPLDNDEPALRKALRQILSVKTDQELVAVFTYVDTKTGQESMRLKKYDIRTIYTTRLKTGFVTADQQKRVFSQFKDVEKDSIQNKKFQDYINGKSYPLDLSKMRLINEGTIKYHTEAFTGSEFQDYTDDNLYMKLVSINFLNPNENGEIPPFVMLCLLHNHRPVDWSEYYEDDLLVRITLKGSPDIKKIDLEVKTTNDSVGRITIPVCETAKTEEIKLRDLFEEKNELRYMREFCLVIWRSYIVSTAASLFIERIELAYPEAPVDPVA